METEGIDLVIIFGCIGISMLLLGISILTGRYKTWWLIESTPIVPGMAAYLGLPASISFFIMAIAMLLPTVDSRVTVFFCGGVVSLVIACILAIWRPHWLTPKWLLWLEDNYPDTFLDLLRREAQQMGVREWQVRVRTQAGLEEWVAQVRQKYGV